MDKEQIIKYLTASLSFVRQIGPDDPHRDARLVYSCLKALGFVDRNVRDEMLLTLDAQRRKIESLQSSLAYYTEQYANHMIQHHGGQ